MTPERLEELRNGKCGEAFEAECAASFGEEILHLPLSVFEIFPAAWKNFAIGYDSAMREVAEEVRHVIPLEIPQLLRNLATYGEEKHNGQQAT